MNLPITLFMVACFQNDMQNCTMVEPGYATVQACQDDVAAQISNRRKVGLVVIESLCLDYGRKPE